MKPSTAKIINTIYFSSGMIFGSAFFRTSHKQMFPDFEEGSYWMTFFESAAYGVCFYLATFSPLLVWLAYTLQKSSNLFLLAVAYAAWATLLCSVSKPLFQIGEWNGLLAGFLGVVLLGTALTLSQALARLSGVDE